MHARVRRRVLAGVVLTTVGALGLSACSSGSGAPGGGGVTIPAKDPKATIRVISILGLKADHAQPVVDAFEKAHPNITVKWQTVPFDALNSTLDADIANKQGNPDVYWADQPRLSALAARGEAEDVTSAFAKYRSTFDPAPYRSGLYKGKLYGVPIANSTQLLYYNKDLLRKAGLPFPGAAISQRTTWESLASNAKKAADAGATNGFVFGQPDRYYQLETLPVSLGGSVGATGKGNLTPDFSGPAWVKAMQFYGSLYKSGASPRGVSAETTDDQFTAGKTAYMVEGPWLLLALQGSKVNWGIAPQPTFAGAKAVTADGSWSLALNPFSKEKQAAAIFMKWMAIDDGAGYIKYRPDPELAASVQGKKEYFAKPIFSSPVGKQAAAIIASETSKTAVNRVSTVGFIEFESILNQAFSDIANGSDPKTTLDGYSAKLKTAWIKYQGQS